MAFQFDPGYLFFPLMFVNFLQVVFDSILCKILGYKTKTGWEKDRLRSEKEYEYSGKSKCIFEYYFRSQKYH